MNYVLAIALLLTLPVLPSGQGDDGGLYRENLGWLTDVYARAGWPIDDVQQETLEGAADHLALRGFSLPARQFLTPPTVAGMGDIVAVCVGEWGPAECFITPVVPSVSTDPVFEELEIRANTCRLPQTGGTWLYRPNSYLVEAYDVELWVHMTGSDLAIPGQGSSFTWSWDGHIAGNGCYSFNQPGLIQIYWSNGVALET